MKSFLKTLRTISKTRTDCSNESQKGSISSSSWGREARLSPALTGMLLTGSVFVITVISVKLFPPAVRAAEIPTTSSGTWTKVSNTVATKITPGGLKMTVTLSGTAMTFGAINNTALQTAKTVTTPTLPSATNGIQVIATSQPSCVASSLTCTGYGTMSFSFTDPTGGAVKVKNPVLHVSRLGGWLSVTANNITKSAVHGSIMDLTTSGVTLGAPSTGSRAFVTTATQLKTDLSVFPNVAASGSAMGDCIAPPGAPQAGCGSIPINGTTSSLNFTESMYRRNVTANAIPGWIEGSSTAADGIYFTMSFDEDFGDAPASYDAGSAASHIVSDLTLGSSITADNTTTFNGGATGTTGLVATSPKAVAAGASNNGLNGDGASDDGVTSFPVLRNTNTTYSVPVSLAGASRAGQVCGWIDTNKNGTFENTAERICANFAAGATTATLNWAGLSGLTVGKTYVRIRATYDTTAVAQTPTGRLSSGEVEDYQLNIDGVPDLTITKTASATTFNRGQKGATFTLKVNNVGNGATNGTVTVTDTLPNGTAGTLIPFAVEVPPAFDPTAITGDGWTCTIGTAPNTYTAKPISCTRSDTLAPGASYPPITVTVDVNSNTSVPTPRANNAAVSGGGEATTTNNAGSVSVTLASSASPDLAITKTHTGNFKAGQTGTYTLTAKNLGPGLTTLTGVTVVDTLPTGLTYSSASGTGWTCSNSGQTITCTRVAALTASGTSYPAITVTVNVAVNAPQSVTNGATVSGGGQTAGTNDTATDPTTIEAPDLTITKTHTGNFSQQQKGAIYTLTATNSGNFDTNGTVTVTDTLPTGLTAKAISGSGWNCTLGTLTCTRSDVLAAGSSYPPITVTVDVATNASTPLVNNATVSGGGEAITTNNTAADPATVTVVADPPVTVSGKVWDDANNSANGTFTNINTGAETGTNGDGLYAVLVDAAGNTIASSVVAADGTYSFSNLLANQNNVKIRLTTIAGVVGAAAPDAEIFADWFNTSPIETPIFNIGTANISGKDFGLEQLPNTSDVFATDAIANPMGSTKVQVPTLIGYDPEDGNLGANNKFRILTLPTTGILYYNNTPVVPGDVISNYDPTLLKVDPSDGAVTVDFVFAAIDLAGKESVNPGTASMVFTAAPADIKLIKRITAINGDRLKNPNDNTKALNGVLNNPATPNDDPGVNWPAGYLVGAYDAGLIKPADEIEYTVYFLNAQGSNANTLKLCDRIIGSQTYKAGSLQIQLGNAASPTTLTDVADGLDRAQFLPTSSSAPVACNLPTIPATATDNGTWAVDVTGAVTANQPAFATIPGATSPGTPTASYGFIRFKTIVNP